MADVVDISEVLRRVTEPFKPQDLVTANDAIVRVTRLRGEFPWHEHDEDELFLCWEGSASSSKAVIRSTFALVSCSSCRTGRDIGPSRSVMR